MEDTPVAGTQFCQIHGITGLQIFQCTQLQAYFTVYMVNCVSLVVFLSQNIAVMTLSQARSLSVA